MLLLSFLNFFVGRVPLSLHYPPLSSCLTLFLFKGLSHLTVVHSSVGRFAKRRFCSQVIADLFPFTSGAFVHLALFF